MKKVLVVLGDPRLKDPVKHGGEFQPEDIQVVGILKDALKTINGYSFEFHDEHETFQDKIMHAGKIGEFDYVVNFCDEGLMNDAAREAEVPHILELGGLRYTGADVTCLLKSFNKHNVKRIARNLGIPTTRDSFIQHGFDFETLHALEFPLFVKPNYGDGSFAIDSKKSLVHSKNLLYNQIIKVQAILLNVGRNPSVLVEEYLPGIEISAAIIGNKTLETKLIQEKYPEKGGFSSHDTKWNPKSKDWSETLSIKPEISQEAQRQIIAYSEKLFRELKCRDYARIDWRMDENGNPKLLEANPNCGWCWDGHLTKAFLVGKYDPKYFTRWNSVLLNDYSQVLHKILQAAEERFYEKER